MSKVLKFSARLFELMIYHAFLRSVLSFYLLYCVSQPVWAQNGAAGSLSSPCSLSHKTIVAQKLRSLLDRDMLVYRPRIHKELVSFDQATERALRQVSRHVAMEKPGESLRMLRHPDFSRSSGVAVEVMNQMILPVERMRDWQIWLDTGAYERLYESFYLEEIESMWRQPRFDARAVKIYLPGELLIESEDKRRVPLRKAMEMGLISDQLGRLLLSLNSLTQLEEVFHAADYMHFSARGKSISPSFNRLLRWAELDHRYSYLTEVAFPVFLRFDLGFVFPVGNEELWRALLNLYPYRQELFQLDLGAALKSAGWKRQHVWHTMRP